MSIKMTFYATAFALLIASPALGRNGVVELPAPVEKIYVPYGFDDNDNVEVVLHGHFDNTCYRIGMSSATIDEDAKTVEVTATTYFYKHTKCFDANIPFIQTVRLGVMKRGVYDVKLKHSSHVAKLTVKPRLTNAPEDYIYAPVLGVQLRGGTEDEPQQTLVLHGRYPNLFPSCIKINEVRLNQTQRDLLVVQPIAEILEGSECGPLLNDRTFTVTTEVPMPITKEGLIHVRVLNGDSLNRYIN